MKKVRVLDQGHFDGFGHAADPIPLGQGGEKVGVVQHCHGWGEGADKILLAKGVNAVFNPDGGIGLGHDRGGHAQQPDAPVGRGRGKPGQVDERPPADGHQIRMAAETGGVDGLLQDGDEEGVVFEVLAAFEQKRRPHQGDGLTMAPAVGLKLGHQLGVVPMDAPVHHCQEFSRRGSVRDHGFLEKRVVGGKQVPGEVDGVAEIHLDILLDGGQGRRHGPVLKEVIKI